MEKMSPKNGPPPTVGMKCIPNVCVNGWTDLALDRHRHVLFVVIIYVHSGQWIIPRNMKVNGPLQHEQRSNVARRKSNVASEEERRQREEEARIQAAVATEERRIEALMGPLPDNLNNFIITVANGSIIKREGGEEREILMNNESGEFTDPFRLTITKAGVPRRGGVEEAIRFMVDQDGMRNVYEVVFDDEINALMRGYADQRSPMGSMFTEMTNLRRIKLENIKWIGDQDNNVGIFSGLKNLRYG